VSFDPARVVRTLAEHEVRYVLVGATSAWLQGNPTVTHDLDLTPQRDVDNAERLAAALEALVVRGHGGRREAVDERDLLGWRNTTFLTDAGRVDVVPELLGVGGYEDLVAQAHRVEVAGVEVLLADLRHVIASKRALDRPKDRAALPALEETLRLLEDRGEA
jgi:hypothetical protein